MDRSGLSAPIVTESVTFLPTVPVSAGALTGPVGGSEREAEEATVTGTVTGGYGVPGCRTSDRVQVTTWPLTEHCQPLPDGDCGVRPSGTWKTTVAVPRVGPAPGSSDTASWKLLPEPPGVNVPEWLTASRRSGASPVTVMPWISWKFGAAPVGAGKDDAFRCQPGSAGPAPLRVGEVAVLVESDPDQPARQVPVAERAA